MIVCLAPGPALDITYRVGALVPGGINRVDEVRERPGGKGVNVATVARALGYAVRLVLPLGGMTGEQVRTSLAQEGLDVEVVPVAAPTRRTVTVVAAGPGHPTGVYEPPAGLSTGERDALTARALDACAPGRILVVSGRLPPGFTADDLAALVEDARRRGVQVVVDTSGPALVAAAGAGAKVLKPNRDELLEVTGEADAVRGARALVRAGAGAVLVSLGADGMLACADGRTLRATGIPPIEGNPTGAGDAAVAAIAAGLADGRPLESILARATAAGAAAVRQPVAGVVDPVDAERLTGMVEIEEES